MGGLDYMRYSNVALPIVSLYYAVAPSSQVWAAHPPSAGSSQVGAYAEALYASVWGPAENTHAGLNNKGKPCKVIPKDSTLGNYVLIFCICIVILSHFGALTLAMLVPTRSLPAPQSRRHVFCVFRNDRARRRARARLRTLQEPFLASLRGTSCRAKSFLEMPLFGFSLGP